MPNEAPDSNARLTRLEESVGFIDHHAGQLGEEVRSLSREIAALARRLSALERRLLDLTDSATEAASLNVPPPHSAGPDVPRDPL